MSLNNQRNLYFIGVGPGDPELLTLKATRLISACDVLFVPVRKKDTTRSMALNVVKEAMDLSSKKIVFLPFPMVKGAGNILSKLTPACESVQRELPEGGTGVLITLGCSTIYSTAANLYKVLQGQGIAMHFVPGVSAISGTAAVSGAPLVFSEERLVVLPTTYARDQIEQCVEDFDTVVLMKVHSSLGEILKIAEKKGCLGSSVIVEKATMREGQMHVLAELPDGYRPHYMSTVVIKSRKRS